MKSKKSVGWRVLTGILMAGAMAEAAVTVTFQEQPDGSGGNDVLISWSGSLQLVPGFPFQLPPGGSNGGALVSSASNTQPGQGMVGAQVGTASTTSLASVNGPSAPLPAEGWGFIGDIIIWGPAIVSGGSLGMPTQLTYDPQVHRYLLPNQTLASLNATNFNNTVAWTANGTGDTIQYQSTTVPEPSVACLAVLAVLGINRRGRRS